MAGDEGSHSQQQEQLKQRQEGEVWFPERVHGGLGAAGIEGDRRENDGVGQAVPTREGPACWAKECGLCQEGHGGGLK